MAFRTADFRHLAKFNSATSSKLLDAYEEIRKQRILKDASEPSSRTFAPSSFRCERKCWFRIRGVQPDAPSIPDTSMDFMAEIGTACHGVIQRNLVEGLITSESGIEWIDVETYLNSIQFGDTYEYTVERNGYETMVEITKPYPIRFSVDGLLRIGERYYLFEVKTAEHASFESLVEPKAQHVDQVTSYCAILRLDAVLFLYQDRQYGDIKVYEVNVADSAKQLVFDKMDRVLDMVEKNLAPEGLPSRDDTWCKYCDYRLKCSQWG